MQTGVFLEGSTVFLRTLEEGDLTESYLQWLNDAEVAQFNSHAIFPNTKEKMLSYFKGTRVPEHAVFAIIAKSENKHIGNAALQNIHWVNRSAEFAILMGDKGFWGKGIGTEVGQLLMEYGFQRLNLHRIHCGTFRENVGMIHIAAKLKMKEEGRRIDAVYKNGKFTDVIEFGLLKHEYFNKPS